MRKAITKTPTKKTKSEKQLERKVTTQVEFFLHDKPVEVCGDLDFEAVYNEAAYLFIGDWNYGEVRQIMPLWNVESGINSPKKTLNEIHLSWFQPADKGTAGCWIGNSKGNIIAQIAYYEDENKFWVASAKTTSDHTFNW